MNLSQIANINQKLKELSTDEILKWAAERFSGKIRFSSSLGLEDQAITQIIADHNLDIPVFTLDTGRLFQQSYELLERSRTHFQIPIRVYFPDFRELESLVTEEGTELFKASPEQRKTCCQIRKINPLKRALRGQHAWVTGLRSSQSMARNHVEPLQWEFGFDLLKVNPLWNWSEEDVRQFLHDHKTPYHPFHDQGYPSIGCAPCTRAVAPGEDPRAGRWWWEQDGTRECGLHQPPQESTTGLRV